MADNDNWLQDVLAEDVFPQLIHTGPSVSTVARGSFDSWMSGVAGRTGSTTGTHLSETPFFLLHQPTYPIPPLSPKTNLILRSRVTRPLASLPHESIAARHAATLISRIIGAFPRMMLRRQTFPPFIHPHWHLDAIPEKLATCMSISHMFVSRTQESRAFLWRTIEAECQYLHDEVRWSSVAAGQTLTSDGCASGVLCRKLTVSSDLNFPKPNCSRQHR